MNNILKHALELNSITSLWKFIEMSLFFGTWRYNIKSTVLGSWPLTSQSRNSKIQRIKFFLGEGREDFKLDYADPKINKAY